MQPDLIFPLFYAQALDLTLAKDERLAVGFFQRSAVMMQIDRYKAAYLAQSKPKSRLSCFYLRYLSSLDISVLWRLCYCLSRMEEALSDCIWAQKHMRENPVIDYRQLGLRFKLYSWQV